MNTTDERVEYVKARIAERRRLAEEWRGAAVGATVSDAAHRLEEARVCEAVAVGMERALAILFP